jgi:hypothetical protein
MDSYAIVCFPVNEKKCYKHTQVQHLINYLENIPRKKNINR